MGRDLGFYLQALYKHLGGLATGFLVTILFWVWQYALHRGDIPKTYWIVAGVIGLFVSGFNAWREEHAKTTAQKTDPAIDQRRSLFEQQISKLDPLQSVAVLQVIRYGDRNGPDLRQSLSEHGYKIEIHDADMALTVAAETGLIEVKEKGKAFGRYGAKPAFMPLLHEWSARPTPTDIRIGHKARELKYMLSASFEDNPTGPNNLDELTTWASKILRGVNATEKVIKDMLDLSAEASTRLQRTVVMVRDDYYAAATPITRLLKNGLSINDANRATVEKELWPTLTHIRACIGTLPILIMLVGD